MVSSQFFYFYGGIKEVTVDCTVTENMLISIYLYILNSQFSVYIHCPSSPFAALLSQTPITYVSLSINPLKTKRRLLYLNTQFVPRSKHFSSRL